MGTDLGARQSTAREGHKNFRPPLDFPVSTPGLHRGWYPYITIGSASPPQKIPRATDGGITPSHGRNQVPTPPVG